MRINTVNSADAISRQVRAQAIRDVFPDAPNRCATKGCPLLYQAAARLLFGTEVTTGAATDPDNPDNPLFDGTTSTADPHRQAINAYAGRLFDKMGLQEAEAVLPVGPELWENCAQGVQTWLRPRRLRPDADVDYCGSTGTMPQPEEYSS